MVAHVKTNEGLLFDRKEVKVVKKVGVAGEELARHNHPEAFVTVTVVKGRVRATFNDTEVHELTPGMVLEFDGDNYIQPTFVEAGEFIVHLITKPE